MLVSYKYRSFAISGALLFAAALLTACATHRYNYVPLADTTVLQRAQTQEHGSLRMRASVPGTEEAKQIFGVDLSAHGIQPVWLQISNNGSTRVRFAPHSLDPDYFTPNEIAWYYRRQFSADENAALQQRLRRLTIPRHIPPGATVSGFVFTHAEPGTKSFNADVLYAGQSLANSQFTFFLEVPGFKPDYANIDFQTLYPATAVQDVDRDGLRALLADMPCCTTNQSGDSPGLPVNVVVVAEGRDLLWSLLRSGWSETAAQRDPAYLSAADHLFGRPPDAIFRKRRGSTTERNELGIWLAPVRVDAKPVWFAQVKHAIGRHYALGEWLLGVRLDPDADEGRNYFLQTLWYAQSLEAFAWSGTSKKARVSNPLHDFNGNPWFSDGFRVVLWLSGTPVSLVETRRVQWDDVLAEFRSEGAP